MIVQLQSSQVPLADGGRHYKETRLPQDCRGHQVPRDSQKLQRRPQQEIRQLSAL
jgi:hypothetical protein